VAAQPARGRLTSPRGSTAPLPTAAAEPALRAVAHGATHQGRQVTIDYAQNSLGRNTVAPYTLRALPRAPVSTPLTWEEVAAGQVRPTDWTLQTVRAGAGAGDRFAPVLQGGQRLPIL
jgi:bifunctional non-homologous end joining protein LigD